MKKQLYLIKINKRHYIYINYIGYYPQKKVVWEAVNKDNCGFAHSFL